MSFLVIVTMHISKFLKMVSHKFKLTFRIYFWHIFMRLFFLYEFHIHGQIGFSFQFFGFENLANYSKTLQIF